MFERVDAGLLPLCEYVANSWLGTHMKASRWAFAITEMVHLIALAILGGGMLTTALCASGAIWKGRPLYAVTRDLAPWIATGLGMLVASGALLFADGPLRYYANGAFRIKLALLIAAVLVGLAAMRAAATASRARSNHPILTVLVLCDALLWLGVGIAGRVIGII